MPDEPNLANGGLGGDSPAEGQAASTMGNSVVNSRLSVDLRMLEGLNRELNTLNENTKKIKSNFKDLIRDTKELTSQLNKAATAMGKVSGKSGSGYMDMSKGMPPAATGPSQSALDADMILKRLMGGGAASGGGLDDSGSKGKGVLGGLKGFFDNATKDATKADMYSALFNGIAAVGQTIDNRVDRNKAYALPADNLSVQLQQQYGMSQMGVMNQLRGPLRQYRLGVGGINELLAMQSRTGLNAQQQAGSVEGIRTLMGYGYSTGDVTNYIESMAQADTVNRMFMMTGTSMYGIGGTQKSAQQVNQELIQRLGLNNREIIQAGRQSGSVIRQRLQMSGLNEGAQDILLQYAEANVGFRERGGKGFYDPSKKADRERMGIEGNYATQVEETERVKVDREEQMYKRQADNYAQMEKNLQNVNKALKQFEDFLSTIIGVKTSTRGFGALLRPAAGILGGIAGLALSGGNPIAAMAGYQGASALVGAFTGDPEVNGGAASPGRIASKNPTTGNKNSVGQQAQLLSQLKPVLREPLSRLMTDRPGITIMPGGAYRSPEVQKQLFKSRYTPTDKKTNTYYEGTYWERKPGEVMTAPPGLSYHEIGLAADLNFASSEDIKWLQANAARYGLDEFSRHGEYWHVQSKAYPASRKQYEENGASYGTENDAGEKYVPETTGSTRETGPGGQSGLNVDPSASITQQLSIAESMASFAQERMVFTMDNSPSGNSFGSGGRGGMSDAFAKKDGGKGHGNTNNSIRAYYRKIRNKIGSNFVSRQTVKSLLQQTSVRGKKLTSDEVEWFLKIASRESGGDKTGNATQYDANALNTGKSDISFGLLQLNMLNRADAYKHMPELKNDFSVLWDPKTNIDMAGKWLMADGLTSTRGNNLYYHWGGTMDNPLSGEGGYKGDPSDTGYSPKLKNNVVAAPATNANVTTTNNTFTISPVININSSGSEKIDAARLAKEVSKLIEKEVQMMNVRSL